MPPIPKNYHKLTLFLIPPRNSNNDAGGVSRDALSALRSFKGTGANRERCFYFRRHIMETDPFIYLFLFEAGFLSFFLFFLEKNSITLTYKYILKNCPATQLH